MEKKIPDERQKKVFKNIVENRGSMRQAMIDAGYSPEYARNPKQFRQTKSWQELLDEHLPDWLLTETHEELLGSEDDNVKLRSVDLGYKIKNKFEPEVTEHVIRNYSDMSDEELEKTYNAKANKRTKKEDD